MLTTGNSTGKYATRLLQLNLVTLKATSDQELFKLLRSNYYSMRSKWTSMFSLRTLEWIKFVHFEVRFHHAALLPLELSSLVAEP